MPAPDIENGPARRYECDESVQPSLLDGEIATSINIVVVRVSLVERTNLG